MGNCVETCRQEDPRSRTDMTDVLEKGPKGGSSGVQVKVVLTKEELEWLLLRLSTTTTRLGSSGGLGNDKLEEFLGQIESARKARRKLNVDVSWKPSLESITEAPEFHEMDRS